MGWLLIIYISINEGPVTLRYLVWVVSLISHCTSMRWDDY